MEFNERLRRYMQEKGKDAAERWNKHQSLIIDRLIIEQFNFNLQSEDGLGHWVYIKEDQDASLFRPSKNISDAWHVLELFDFSNVERVTGYGEFYRVTLSVAQEDGTYNDVEAEGSTAPIAICRAALQSVDVPI